MVCYDRDFPTRVGVNRVVKLEYPDDSDFPTRVGVNRKRG